MGEIAGWIAFALLVCAPGAWLSSLLPQDSSSLSARLALAIVLSPLVLAGQFYLVRSAGVPFAALPWLLAAVNAPALWVAARRWERGFPVSCASVLAWTAALAIPLACLIVPMLLWPQDRLFWSHSWMHSDLVYALAGGALRPEEPELAGVAVSYPWVGHIYQALLSRSISSPPFASYMWTNLVCLAAILVFVSEITRALGGGIWARCGAVVALLFGVNAVGYWLGEAHQALDSSLPSVFGDWRYTPWLWKFRFFSQMPIALGACAGVAYLLTGLRGSRQGVGELVLLGSVLLALGLAYALLLPVAYSLVLGHLLVTAPLLGHRPWPERLRPWIGPGIVLAVVGLISIGHAVFVRQDTVGGTGMALSAASAFGRKMIVSAIVTLPLLAAVIAVLRSLWPRQRARVGPLLVGGLGSLMLFAVLAIPNWSNEYKFVFTAALCLAPIAGLAIEPCVRWLGRGALPAVLIVSFMLAARFAFKAQGKLENRTRNQPSIISSRFDVRLTPGHPLAPATDAIRTSTPRNTIVVAEGSRLHLPTLVQRSFYVPPAQKHGHAGVSMLSLSILLNPRAHDPVLVRRRVAELRGLFDASDERARASSLRRMLSLGRPLAILLNVERHVMLDRWLGTQASAEVVQRDSRSAVWLLNRAP